MSDMKLNNIRVVEHFDNGYRVNGHWFASPPSESQINWAYENTPQLKTAKEYEILFGECQDDIEKVVNEYISNGYKLSGGICIHNTGYYQAVHK